MQAISSSFREPTTPPVAERDTGQVVCSKKLVLLSRPDRERGPLANLERLLLVAAFALYLGAVALQVLEDVYVEPLVAAIAAAEQR